MVTDRHDPPPFKIKEKGDKLTKAQLLSHARIRLGDVMMYMCGSGVTNNQLNNAFKVLDELRKELEQETKD